MAQFSGIWINRIDPSTVFIELYDYQTGVALTSSRRRMSTWGPQTHTWVIPEAMVVGVRIINKKHISLWIWGPSGSLQSSDSFSMHLNFPQMETREPPQLEEPDPVPTTHKRIVEI